MFKGELTKRGNILINTYMTNSFNRQMVLLDVQGGQELWSETENHNGKAVETKHWLFEHYANKTVGYPVPLHTLFVEAAKYWLDNLHKQSAMHKSDRHIYQR